MTVDCVILAAGNGTRMMTTTPKFFQSVAGRPIIRYAIDACSSVMPAKVISVTSVAHKDNELFTGTDVVVQERPLGTADALKQAIPQLGSEYVIVMYADTPFVERKHLEMLLADTADVAFIAARMPDGLLHTPYGRVITDGCKFRKIVEFKDASGDERTCNLMNAGVYKFKTELLKRHIDNVTKDNESAEFYLTELLEIIKESGVAISVIRSDDYLAFHGINTMSDLTAAEEIMQNRLRESFLQKGVRLVAPASVYFSHDTEIAADVVVEPNVFIGTKVKIRTGVVIKAFSYIEGCEIMEHASVGPFARIRGNSRLESATIVGNFVEIKGSVLGKSTKVKHLSYVGDADIGDGTNIGAGTITCNYDGVRKHKTSIGKYVFVGSNSVFIAPVTVEDEALVAAGSVVDQTVQAGSLAIARPQLVIRAGKAKQIWQKKKK